ncbi:MAG: cytochrome c biogenesis protein CcsA [Pseudomonadota bacterium]
MIALTSGMLAVLFYSLSALLQGQSLTRNTDSQQKILSFALVALAAHLVNVIEVIATDAGYDFGFFRIATLFSWTISLIVVISSLKKPLANLFLVVFPIAILSILCSLFLPSRYNPLTNIENGVALHIVLGIAGFSLITIAAVQALLIAWLNRELKRKHFTTVLRHMPPLQTMEALLFEIIWAGFFVLLAVIITGFLFMDDMFAQHLVHKTVLTLISWGVFGVLLWGRHQLGWRGKTAMRWTLTGFIVLILAYFGSKFVLELLLNRV